MTLLSPASNDAGLSSHSHQPLYCLQARQGAAPLSPAALITSAWSKPPDVLLQFDDGSQLPAHRCILELCSPLLQVCITSLALRMSTIPSVLLITKLCSTATPDNLQLLHYF
jgi:hypothetical protein